MEEPRNRVHVVGLAELQEYEQRVLSERDTQYNTGGSRTSYWRYGWRSCMTMVFTKVQRLESGLRRLDAALEDPDTPTEEISSILDDIKEACADGRNYLAFQYEEALLRAIRDIAESM